ncbi:hypothetical protein [Rhizobium laguerreae]|uniref:hypothetical protein n=1 Tax=Rhizobium laguerreae TaxID=1076926 RepID=UPI001C903937|nr:hypothetical protein [Rhizobium laguerreae]MBY3389216.1 hypothetical protein [Rhizobium laguerreae]MBY3402967.1 hypothetical protein [Rhizobium laguerreae]MBY3409906.1 hypothetical protein [Rhizobium laguerreae]
MPIEIECHGFAHPLSALNGRNHLQCSKWKLFLAALSCGYDGFFKNFGSDWYRRVTHIRGNLTPFLDTRPGRVLALSNYYFDVDNSENKQAAYFIGQGLTKLFACQILNAPMVVHASRSIWKPSVGLALKAPLLTVGRKEADLFAFGPSGIHVLESKGRSVRHGVGRLSGSVMNSAMGEALGQVSAIQTVNGIAPISRSGCVWTLCTSGFRGDIQDPPGAGWDATVAPTEALRSNYALFLEADQGRFRSDLVPGYSLIELPGSENSGLYVGIFTEILQAVSSGRVAIETVMSLASSQLTRLSRTPAIEYLEDGTLIFGLGRRDFFTEEQLPPETTGIKNVVQQELKEEFSWQTGFTADEEQETVKIYLTE